MGESQLPTVPIANRAKKLYLEAWVNLLSPPNLLAFAIKKEKNYKIKTFGSQTRRKRKVTLPALLAIAVTIKQLFIYNETLKNPHSPPYHLPVKLVLDCRNYY